MKLNRRTRQFCNECHLLGKIKSSCRVINLIMSIREMGTGAEQAFQNSTNKVPAYCGVVMSEKNRTVTVSF